MELGQQFKIDSIEELEEAYEMFDFDESLSNLRKSLNRWVVKTPQGTFLAPKYQHNKTIPSPLVKRSKPKQYADGIDTFERMEKNATFEERIAFAKGNIDKYVWRKKDQDKQDFEKIIKYAQWAIKQYK